MNAALVHEWLQTGLRHHQAGRLTDAARWYGKARSAAPQNFEALNLDGARALQQGQFEEAVALLTQARRRDPKSAICALRLGIALRRTGKLAEAAEAFRAATELQPGNAEAHERLGALIASWKGPAAGEPILRRATEAAPKSAPAWCNLGLVCLQQAKLGEAMAALNRAIELNPQFDHAHAARGLTLSKSRQPAAAIKAFGRALELNPRNFETHSALLMELQYDSAISRADLFAAHRRFGTAVAEAAPAGKVSFPPRGERLRVGFLSPDLHQHSVAYFLEPLLAHLDRSQFEVLLYHDKPEEDEVSARLRAHAAGWRTTAGMPGDVLEKLLRSDRLDLLVDLAGHTGQNRLPLYARRLAPVQATYLGYPDTTGLAAMDYRLVDAVTDPEGPADACATERLLRFAATAWSYAPPADAPPPGPSPAAAGGPVTFGCFNNPAKISDRLLAAWARILKAVPDSRLLLKGYGLRADFLHADLVRRMDAAGIASDRCELLDCTPRVADHLDLYRRVDVALDTFPYHGTTTTCEALWMGVPVAVWAGDRHASRVGASLVTAVGHPEWIAQNEDEYVAGAVRLAGAARAESSPRLALREAMRGSALLDHPGQAARFGAALARMHAERTASVSA
ncbi:MAG TPA: tetratricopeptide repeat protein [Opitutaceae bacterium]|jgi:predicted O-linked N-acetylglucosamine transferase (SPINDLY family)|nr:tetratricopeptide repeat protein [Opitutaceae bacterium]